MKLLINNLYKRWMNAFGGVLLFAVILHALVIGYSFTDSQYTHDGHMVFLNSVADTDGVITAMNFFIEARKGVGPLVKEYTTSHIYPNGYSVLIMPGELLLWTIHAWRNPTYEKEEALVDGAPLAFVSARLVNLALFVLGAVYMRKIAERLKRSRQVTFLCFCLYVCSPFAMLFAFQERPHLPTAFLLVPAMYYSLRAIETKKRRDMVIAGAWAGVCGSIIQYGFVPYLGLASGIFFMKDVARKKIIFFFISGLACLTVALLFGYPSLFVHPFDAILNQTHRPSVLFNGTGFVEIIKSLWIYEPLILLWTLYAVWKHRHVEKSEYGIAAVCAVPLLSFIAVFGPYGAVYSRQVGGVYSLFIICILYFLRDQVPVWFSKLSILVGGIAVTIIGLSLFLNKPTSQLAYEYVAGHVASDREIVYDTIPLVSYVDPISTAITRYIILGDESIKSAPVNAYRRFPFLLIYERNPDYFDVVMTNAKPRFVVVRQQRDLLGYRVAWESPYKDKVRAFPFNVGYEGRSKMYIYERTK